MIIKGKGLYNWNWSSGIKNLQFNIGPYSGFKILYYLCLLLNINKT